MSIDPTNILPNSNQQPNQPIANPFGNDGGSRGYGIIGLPPEPVRSKSSGPHRVKFSGEGADYFGIWIVNLLLIVVTAGIYSPWAKVRREKYFHQHTQIDGSSLDYHGNPIAILIGRVLTLGLIAMVSFGNQLSLTVAITAGLFLAGIIPFAMQRSIRFRLFNTSYRGLRFGFHGSVAQAYGISWLIVLFGYAAFIAPAWLNEVAKGDLWVAGLATFGLFIAYPFFHAAWRRFVISHAQYGSVNAQAKFSTSSFIWIYLKSWLLMIVIPGVVIAAIVIYPMWSSPGLHSGAYFGAILAVPLIFVFYAFVLSFAPIVAARLQNLCWNENTVVSDQNNSQVAVFTSDLSVKKFVTLQLKNQILTVLTLGLYRPYAAIATAKMRLEAISISSLTFVDDVAARAGQQKSAIGDQALDAVGLDFSL